MRASAWTSSAEGDRRAAARKGYMSIRAGYRRYGRTAYSLALELNSKDAGRDNALLVSLESVPLQERPAILRQVIMFASCLHDDLGISRLIPVFERSVADAAWSDVLVPEEDAREPDQYQYPDAEYLWWHPATARHRKVPDAMIDLYRALPVRYSYPHNDDPALPIAKKRIIESLMTYWGVIQQPAHDKEVAATIMDFLLGLCDKTGFHEKEFAMWDAAFRNARSTRPEEFLRSMVKHVIESRAPVKPATDYKMILVRTFMSGWVQRASLTAIEKSLKALE